MDRRADRPVSERGRCFSAFVHKVDAVEMDAEGEKTKPHCAFL